MGCEHNQSPVHPREARHGPLQSVAGFAKVIHRGGGGFQGQARHPIGETGGGDSPAVG
jgi:hypothetical protein